MSVMPNQSFSMNNVKEAGGNSGEDLSPGRCSIEQQGGPSCHITTAKAVTRRKCYQEINRIIMECYYSSSPEEVGYTERTHMVWKKKEMFDVK